MSYALNPANSRNYFSASFFSRDILIPSFFSAPFALQLFIFFPDLWEIVRAEMLNMNIYYFLLSGCIFVSVSVAATMFLDRILKEINKNVLRYILPYVDFHIYYEKSAREIGVLFDQVLEAGAMPEKQRDNMKKLKTREKMNALLRLSERILPEAYLILARLYSFIAVAHAIILAQIVFITLLFLFHVPHDPLITFSLLISLIAIQIGFIHAAASSEMDVLRASVIALDMDTKNTSENEKLPSA